MKQLRLREVKEVVDWDLNRPLGSRGFFLLASSLGSAALQLGLVGFLI